MRFATIIASGLFAVLAAAQSSGSEAPSATVSLDPAQESSAACIKACAVGDVNCQAHCIAVPSPNQSQVNATTDCVAKCPQGDGSPSQTETYKNCVQGCIANHYFVTSEGTPEPTGASGSSSGNNNGDSSGAAAPTASGSDGSGSGASKTQGSGASSTETGASSASSSATSAGSAIVASGASLLGVFAAILAL